MAHCQLSIRFDRKNRTWSHGEDVSGHILLQTDKDLRGKTLTVGLRWSCFGRGNALTGPPLSQDLRDLDWFAGREYKYPFCLTLPKGPPSYAGHHFSIDYTV